MKYIIQLSLLLLCLFMLPASAEANKRYASLVIDADTGAVLHQRYAGARRYPASLTKVMTLYLVFDALDRGRLRLDQKLYVSKHAAAQPASKLGLRKGQSITVRQAVLSLIIKSANDAAVVLAEAVSGSEWQFARLMNSQAKKLGMRRTSFRNASGLYHRKQVSTAYDMARLAVAMYRDFPRYYDLFNRTRFTYRGRTYTSHNRVTRRYRGADGLKTGYLRASGYNLMTSAKRGNHRVVAIVLGGRTAKRRDNHMINLLNRSFSKLRKGGAVENAKRLSIKKPPIPILKQSPAKWVDHPVPRLKAI